MLDEFYPGRWWCALDTDGLLTQLREDKSGCITFTPIVVSRPNHDGCFKCHPSLCPAGPARKSRSFQLFCCTTHLISSAHLLIAFSMLFRCVFPFLNYCCAIDEYAVCTEFAHAACGFAHDDRLDLQLRCHSRSWWRETVIFVPSYDLAAPYPGRVD